MQKVLIVTYYWPPGSGAGVQRWLKFSKYLPQYGWEPFILTVDPQFAAYPSIDRTLEKEIPENVKVFRTKATDWFRIYSKDKSKIPTAGFANNYDNSFKGILFRFLRGNFFIPDPRRGWNKFAFRKACELIETHEISHIITTSPPHSTQLIGLRLKKRFPEINWISDLRDAWTDIYYYDLFYPTFISRSIDRHFEKEVLDNADQIITVGNNLAKIFKSKKAGIDSKIFIIPNGYDEEDFEGKSPVMPAIFTITYVGTMSEVYPLDGLLSALAHLEKDGVDFLLRFAGIIPPEIKAKINRYLSNTKTDFISYVPHQEAIRLMRESSLLLLVIPETMKNEAIVTGKVFEYIAAGKPVLYIGPPDGDAAYHLKHCGHTGIFTSDSIAEMTEFLKMNAVGTISFVSRPHPEYSRMKLTNTLSILLNNKN